MKWLDPMGWFVTAIVIAFLMGIGIGANFGESQLTEDCDKLGRFHTKTAVYDCTLMEGVE